MPHHPYTQYNSDSSLQSEPELYAQEHSIADAGYAQEQTQVLEESTSAVIEPVEQNDQEQTSQEQAKPNSPTVEKKTVLMEFDYRITGVPWNPLADQYFLPSRTTKGLAEDLERVPNFKLGTGEEQARWAQVIRNSASNTTFGDALVESLERDSSQYRQYVENSGVKLYGSSPKFKETQNQSLKGESAVIRVISYLGMGSLFQVPLWHSGFWITFKPPSEAALVELQRIIMSDKIQLGRFSYGRLYSGMTAYTVDRLLNFALDHVYDCTVKSSEISINQLKEYIAIEDIFPLLWGFMATVYPKGFQYERACTADPEKCHHVVQERLNLSRLLWVDNAALTPWQKAHMAARSSQCKDKDSILRYRQEINYLFEHRYKLNEDPEREIYIQFKIGFAKDYIEASQKWIQEIVDSVEKVASQDLSAEEKENLIIAHGKSSTLRQSTHQVKCIEFDSNIIEDAQTIEETLNVLSADDAITNRFFKLLNEFNNNATIAVVGIPTYNCPNCGQEQKTTLDNPQFVNIIPLDVIQLFFDLITQRMQRIDLR
jgi:hypothetical protein